MAKMRYYQFGGFALLLLAPLQARRDGSMGGARWVESMCAGGVRGKQENRPSGEEEEEGTQRARLVSKSTIRA
ncbi:hypothetical protein T484DRAFT_1794630 [Baffinella frigidus]|nr:hypothetical protein T484DRAFT_1794630 [Cryptophyta sp. CCMP2293]